MYKLYWGKGTGAFAVQAALAEAGAEYDLVEVDLDAGAHREADFLTLNPRAQVPVLELPDGTVLTESAAMLLHIADAHPWASLLPPPGDPDRARAYRWILFGAVNVYETVLRVYYSDRYTSDPQGAGAVRRQAESDLDGYWAMLAAGIGAGPYVLGDVFCAADIYYLMFAQWHPDRSRLTSTHPKVERLCGAVRARAAVAALWPQYFD